MLVKIYSEFMNSSDVEYFVIRDDSKVMDLEMKLLPHISVPADCIKFKHLDRFLENCDDLTSVWSKGDEIELYARDGCRQLGRLRLTPSVGGGGLGGGDDDFPMEAPATDEQPQVEQLQQQQQQEQVGDPGFCHMSNSMETHCSMSEKKESDSMSGSTQCCPPDPCEVICCDQDGNRPPYANVMPEDRRFGVVIVNDENPCDCDFSCVLIFLVQQFETSDMANRLTFSQCITPVKFDCLLMIFCENEETQEWVLRSTRPITPPFKCTQFIRHFELVRCSFVIPLVVKYSLCRVFRVLEKQNCGLDTSKWCVVRKTKLSPCCPDNASKIIYDGAMNMEISLYMDEESKEYISNHCGIIKYIVWQLPVDCCQLKDCPA